MQAVILAGGLGTRLRPLTYEVPKVLVPVAGRPFLDWLIATLPPGLFSDLLLLIGYLGEQVRDHCGDGSRYGLPIRYSQEPAPLGTAGALRFAARLLADRFVLINGDTYVEPGYAALKAAHRASPRVGTMVVGRSPDPAVGPNLRLEPDGRISRYAKGHPSGDLNAVDAGVTLFERSVLDHIPDRYRVGLEEGVYQELSVQGLLHGFWAPQPFYDMGTPALLEALTRHLEA